MNNGFFGSHNQEFQGHIKSLYELSKPKEEEIKAGKIPVLEDCEHAKKIEAVDFDAVRQIWYPWQPGKNVPCSADSLVFQKNGTYLIEFKSGKPETANLYRKVYDSVLMLLEHDNQKLRDMRESVTYIVVSAELENCKSKNADKQISRSLRYKNASWEYTKIYDRWKLCNLEQVIVSKTYCMPPRIFENFVSSEKWE